MEEIKNKLVKIVGADNVSKWLNTPCVMFGNKTPQTLIDSGKQNFILTILTNLEKLEGSYRKMRGKDP